MSVRALTMGPPEHGSVSQSVADDWIYVWKQARLRSGHAVGWSSESIWSRLAEMRVLISVAKGSRVLLPPPTENEDRAMIVQQIVDTMPAGIRAPFEAYHVGIIRGDYCRHLPQKVRAIILGLERSVYYDRIDAGRRFVARRLGELLEQTDGFAQTAL